MMTQNSAIEWYDDYSVHEQVLMFEYDCQKMLVRYGCVVGY